MRSINAGDLVFCILGRSNVKLLFKIQIKGIYYARVLALSHFVHWHFLFHMSPGAYVKFCLLGWVVVIGWDKRHLCHLRKGRREKVRKRGRPKYENEKNNRALSESDLGISLLAPYPHLQLFVFICMLVRALMCVLMCVDVR